MNYAAPTPRPTMRRLIATALAATTALTITVATPAHAATGDVTTIAGGTQGFADGNGTNAKFRLPAWIAADPAGNLYVTDSFNNRIRKITPNGDVTTIAGDGTVGFADGNGTNARFNSPQGITIDPANNLYIADSGNNRIRKITPNGDVTTIAGDGTAGFADANGTNARFTTPYGITIDPAGNLSIADTYNNRIRRIDANNNVTTIAGGTPGFADANGSNAQFNLPTGITIDPAGNLYIADTINHRIRKIDTNNNVTTIAGTGTQGFTDGNGANAEFFRPFGMTIDPARNLYVADSNNHTIRRIDTNNNVTTIAGTGTPGFADANGSNAKFNVPTAITIDPSGNLFIADFGNNRIRRIERVAAPAPAPAPAPVPQVSIAPVILPPTTAVATTTAAPSTTTPPTTTPAATTPTTASPTTTALPTTTAPAPSAITPATPLLAEPDFTG